MSIIKRSYQIISGTDILFFPRLIQIVYELICELNKGSKD